MLTEFKDADALREAGNWQEAADAARRILAHSPSDAEAWALLALVLSQLKRTEEAEQAARQALVLSPRNPRALRALAGVRLRQNKTDEASDLAELAVAEAPQDPLALSVLAAVRMTQQRAGEADALLSRAMDIAPLAEVHANRALLEFQRGKLDVAVHHAELATQKKPALTSVWRMLALVNQRLGQLEGAVAALQEFLRREPDDAAALCTLGLMYRDQGRTADAMNAFRTALDFDPGLTAARVGLGRALLVVGQHEEGLELLAREEGIVRFDVKRGLRIVTEIHRAKA